jgi:hypothetical protein
MTNPDFMKKHITNVARGMFNLGKNSKSKVRSQGNRNCFSSSGKAPNGFHPKDRQNAPKV